MYEMCSAISHIYKQHILHNDIKSNNFVVEEVGNQNRTVLTDFGKATKINKKVRDKLPKYTTVPLNSLGNKWQQRSALMKVS